MNDIIIGGEYMTNFPYIYCGFFFLVFVAVFLSCLYYFNREGRYMDSPIYRDIRIRIWRRLWRIVGALHRAIGRRLIRRVNYLNR
jgi:hypothetical protein